MPRKQDAGGQSERRFEANRELLLCSWFCEVNKRLLDAVMEYPSCSVLLGIWKCNESRFAERMHSYVQKRLVGMDSVGYINRNGVDELIERCKQKLKDYDFVRSSTLVEEFGRLLGKGSPLADYGVGSVGKNTKRILYKEGLSDDELKVIANVDCEKHLIRGSPIVDSLRICVVQEYIIRDR